jgi:RimJ/RimL family protein N-acetyltransferase
MANLPVPKPVAKRCRLVPFDAAWAEVVVSWVRDAQEAYWLAPKSAPPLTPGELLRWRQPDHNPYLLVEEERRAPVGYGELNRMAGPKRQYWLGHLLVDPAFRGRGYGVQLTARLLEEAFEQRGAQRVTLVAFPENVAALACYRAAGLVDDGWEWHTFPAYGRRACLLRLAASRPG